MSFRPGWGVAVRSASCGRRIAGPRSVRVGRPGRISRRRRGGAGIVYVEALKEEALKDEVFKGKGAFPPVDVFDDNTDYWMANGFHRHEAHRQLGRRRSPARSGRGRELMRYGSPPAPTPSTASG